MKNLKKILLTFLPYLGYVGVVVVVFGRALWPPADQLIFGDDIHHQYWFYRQFFNDSLARGIIPWWNPYNFAGMPFVANPILNMWYPPTWLFTIYPLNIAYSVHLAMHLVLAMSGMYWMVKQIIPPSRSTPKAYTMEGGIRFGAWIAGVIFGLSGFFTARIWAGHVDMIAAASFMPWVFGMFWRAFQTNSKFEIRNSKLVVHAGLVLGVQLLAGYQTMAIFTMEAVLVAAVVIAVGKRTLRPLVIVLLGSVIGGGITAIQLVPLYQALALSIRTYTFPYNWVSAGAAPLYTLRHFVDPFAFGTPDAYLGIPPNYHEHAGFFSRIGIVVAALALFRLRDKNVRMTVVTLFIIGVVALWIAMAGNAPFDLQRFFYDHVPLYGSLRFPTRHYVLVAFAAAGLTGVMLTSLKHRAILILIAVVVLIEMVPFARSFIRLKPLPETRHDPYLVQTVSQDEAPYRLLQNYGVWVVSRDSLDHPATMSYNIFSASGYDVAIPKTYYEFFDAVNKEDAPSILEHDVQVPILKVESPYMDFLNIKYITVPHAYDPLQLDTTGRLTRIHDSVPRSYRLYVNRDAQDRYYFVPNVMVVADRDAVREAIRDGEVDLHTAVLLSAEEAGTLPVEAYACTPEDTMEARVSVYTPNGVTIETNSSCGGVLVGSDVLFPGWEVRVDGKKQDIYEANLAFRAVYVPEGKHTVEYRYIPTIYIVGASITVLTSLTAGMILRKFGKKS